MFDIKAGRQAEAVLVSDDIGLGLGLDQLAPADPNRMSLMLAANFETPKTNVCLVEFRSGSGSGPPLAILSPESPMVVLHVAQVGQLVTGAVWARKWGADNVTAMVSAVRWNLPVEQLT